MSVFPKPGRTKLKTIEAAGRDGLTSLRPEHDSGRCSALLPAVCVWYLSRRHEKRHYGDRTPQALREAELCMASEKQTDLQDSLSLAVFTPLWKSRLTGRFLQTQKLNPGLNSELLRMRSLIKLFMHSELVHVLSPFFAWFFLSYLYNEEEETWFYNT